jgi:hypothetical protein
MFNTIVGAGAASRYGSGSDQKMRLRLRNTANTVYWQPNSNTRVYDEVFGATIARQNAPWPGRTLIYTALSLDYLLYCTVLSLWKSQINDTGILYNTVQNNRRNKET